MKILTHYDELVGKKIVFSHMAQFAEQITLATECGSVLMATFDVTDYEEQEIRVLGKGHVLRVMGSDRGKFIREELGKMGIFDLKSYKKEQLEIEERKREQYKKEREIKEREELERLKAKFEVTTN